MRSFIANVVLSTPIGRWDEENNRVEGPERELATFYCELLGMRIFRDDWIKTAHAHRIDSYAADPKEIDFKHPYATMLAFGDGPSPEYRRPGWKDPDNPQQLHMEFPVRDLDAAGSLALELGATLLEERGDSRTYADPFGHAFCLYVDASDPASGDRPLSGRIGRIVFDCVSPRALASFYEGLLDMRTRVRNDWDRVEIAGDDPDAPALGFQHAVAVAPRWPDPAYPQQVHLDIYFDDIAEAKESAESLGAVPLPGKGGSCAVYADPAGHPFCLCTPGQ